MNKEIVISNAIVHAEKIHHAIGQRTCPTKDDCCAVLEDLAALRGLHNQYTQKEVARMSIEALFKDFTQYAETSKTHLETMLSFISGGRVPSAESVREFNSSIDSLRQKYSSVWQAALEQLPAEEMPGENAPAEEYVEAVRNSQSLRLKKRLDAAADCLRKFLAVRSLTDNYLSALMPFQDKAKDLLLSLSQSNGDDLEQIEEQTIAPRTLIAAIECEDKDSEEEIELYEKLDEFYPKRISIGVAKEQYYIDNSAYELLKNSVEEPDDAADQEPSQDVQPGSVSQTTQQHADPVMDKAADQSEESSEEDLADTEDSDANDAKRDSGFVSAIKEAGCLYDSDADLGTLDVDIGAGEGKKITSTVFTNEMKLGDVQSEKMIIQSICSRDYVSERYLTDVKKVPIKIASASLAYMQKKGYLRKYQLLSTGDTIYFASPRLKKALTFQDASKFAGVRRRSLEEWGTPIEDTAANAAARIAGSESFINSVCRLTEKGVMQYTENTGLLDSSFCCAIYDTDNPSDCEMSLGAFWSSDEDCDKYCQSVRKEFEKRSGVSSITFSSFDLAHAAAFASVMLQEFGELTYNAPVSLYSLSNHAYYSYPLQSAVTNGHWCGGKRPQCGASAASLS